METITSLLRRLVALLTALVMTMTGSDAIDGGVSLLSADDPVFFAVSPLSDLVAYVRRDSALSIEGPYYNTSGYRYFIYANQAASYGNAASLMVGIPVKYSSGTEISVSWGLDSSLLYGNVKTDNSRSSWSSSPVSNSFLSKGDYFMVYDSQFNILKSVPISDGGVTFTLTRDVTFIGVGYQSLTSPNGYFTFSLGVVDLDIHVVEPEPEPTPDPTPTIDERILAGVEDIAESNRGILDSIDNLAGVVGTPSAMERFEQKYLESMEDQLDKVESMLSPDNPALPNNGDIAGFVSDIQDGLGLSGSSFNASEFAEATSAFGGSSATAAGGPWEFFTQAVADSLAGDTSSVGLADDDYIYVWLEQMQGRYGSWHSFSP